MLLSGSPRPDRRRRRLKHFLLAAGAVLALQVLCLELRIPAVKPESFAERAVELKVTRKWHYGYMQLWHGAVLVKAPNTDILANPVGEMQPVEWEGEVYGVMQRQLEALPRKAALEAALYLGILAYVFFGWGRLKGAFLARRRRRERLLLATVLNWTLLWVIAGLPLLVWGYGTPLFTNCVGPGALSSSGIFLGWAPAYSSTISYHYLLAALAPFCLVLLTPISFAWVWLPGITEGQVLWLGGLFFFVSLGLACAQLWTWLGQGERPNCEDMKR
jgi:hypothetical protein